MIFKLVLVSLLALYIYRRIVVPLLQCSYYKSQGVKFLPGIPIVSDLNTIVKYAKRDPTQNPFYAMIEESNLTDSEGHLPPMIGFTVPSQVILLINSVESLEEIYIKQNKFHSKDPMQKFTLEVLLGDNIVF